MYLISIYFDEKTNRTIQQYIKKVAEQTGNTLMLDGNVPPHITISAFEAIDEQAAIDTMNCIVNKLHRGLLEWVSVGQFFPYVIFLSPVLNEYLHEMSVQITNGLEKTDKIKISPYYQPFHWLPHTTIGKTLSKKEMKVAFDVLQNNFSRFSGEALRIGLAKPTPHRDIASWELS